jgi:hypothetical protein
MPGTGVIALMALIGLGFSGGPVHGAAGIVQLP